MTKETKIGLLVGLAFIIVVGILLSDHLTQTNEPQQAQLAQVAGNVRTGVTVPGAAQAAPAGAAAGAAAAPTQTVAPQQTVPTKEELTPAKPPVEIVQIGAAPAHGGAAKPTDSQTSTPPVAPAQGEQGEKSEQGVASVDSNSAPVGRATDSSPVGGSLANVAHTMGEDVVPAGSKGEAKSAARAESKTATVALALPPGSRQYKAEAGDSVSKMASKLMGGNTKANRDAIIAVNPTLQQNANMVIAGRTYVIRGGGAAPSQATSQQPASASPAPAPAPVPAAVASASDRQPPASATPQYFYTVKPGDSLTKIAVMQLGSADAVPAIMDLNKETLKGKETIRPNMKLRLPAKPIASAE